MSSRIGQVAILGLFHGLCRTVRFRHKPPRPRISGVVRDAQGGGIPNTAISAVQIDTGQTPPDDQRYHWRITRFPICRSATTGSRRPRSGFKKIIIPSIELQVNQEARVDLNMEVGALTEQVTVIGTSSLAGDGVDIRRTGGGEPVD